MRLACLCLAALVLVGCSKESPAPAPSSGGAPALTKVRLKMDWYPQAEHGGFYQALAKGYYKEAGLDVDILPGGPGPLVPQIVLGGDADIGVVESDALIQNVAIGLPFVLVGTYMQHDPQSILVHDDSPVKSLADLDGHTVMAAPGVDWISYIQAKYKIQFKLIPLNFGLAQFMADKGFIQQCFITNEPYYVAKNGGKARALLIADSGFNPYRALFTTQRYARENPAVLKAFVAASIRGWQDYMTQDPGPADALILARNKEMTQEFLTYSREAMRKYALILGKPELGERTGMMTAKRLFEISQTLADLKIIPTALPVEKFASFDFLPPDLQALAR